MPQSHLYKGSSNQKKIYCISLKITECEIRDKIGRGGKDECMELQLRVILFMPLEATNEPDLIKIVTGDFEKIIILCFQYSS